MYIVAHGNDRVDFHSYYHQSLIPVLRDSGSTRRDPYSTGGHIAISRGFPIACQSHNLGEGGGKWRGGNSCMHAIYIIINIVAPI